MNDIDAMTVQAGVRARRLLAALLQGDESAVDLVHFELNKAQRRETREGGYPYQEWELVALVLGIFAVGQRLAVVGIDVNQLAPGEAVPSEAIQVLQSDLDATSAQARKVALKIQLALLDADFYHVEVSRLVGGTVEFWPLLLALCDLIREDQHRRADVALLAKCLQGIDALLTHETKS